MAIERTKKKTPENLRPLIVPPFFLADLWEFLPGV
jgi:hypothetical protein